MKQQTLVALRAIIEADAPKNGREREQLRRVLGLDGDYDSIIAAPVDSMLSVASAAAVFQRSRKWIHDQCKAGHLTRAMLPGGRRGSGVMRSSVDRLLETMRGGAA